jgi:hypothetical protein
MYLLVIIWLICGIGAAVIASNRGANGCVWFAFGVLLGPIGVACAFLNKLPLCPFCKTGIPKGAVKCRHCQSAIPPVIPSSRAPAAARSKHASEILIAVVVAIMLCFAVLAMVLYSPK